MMLEGLGDLLLLAVEEEREKLELFVVEEE